MCIRYFDVHGGKKTHVIAGINVSLCIFYVISLPRIPRTFFFLSVHKSFNFTAMFGVCFGQRNLRLLSFTGMLNVVKKCWSQNHSGPLVEKKINQNGKLLQQFDVDFFITVENIVNDGVGENQFSSAHLGITNSSFPPFSCHRLSFHLTLVGAWIRELNINTLRQLNVEYWMSSCAI